MATSLSPPVSSTQGGSTRASSSGSEKVLVGLGSGSDSLVVAWLLKKQGKSLRGVYFDLLNDPARNEWIRQQEKKLGFPIQILNVEEEVKTLLKPLFVAAKVAGERVSLRGLFQREILFPKLFELRAQHHFDKVSTGHSVQLQYDQVEKVARVYQALDSKEDESRMLLGVQQDWLKFMELPLGSIPGSMVDRISNELKLDDLLSLKDHQVWKDLENQFLEALPEYMKTQYEVYSFRGERLGFYQDGWSVQPGAIYVNVASQKTEVAQSEPYFVWRVDTGSRRIIVGQAPERSLTQFKMKEATWFSVSGLKMKGLECHMTWWNCDSPIPVKVLEYEGGRLKVLTDQKLQGKNAAIYAGNTVLFVRGQEVLGGAEVMSCE